MDSERLPSPTWALAPQMLQLAAWLAGVCALLALPGMAQAQSVTTVPSTAEVISEVTLSKTRDMDFGRVIVPRNGRIDMTAEETPTCTPNNGLTPLDACESASFEGRAGNGFQIRISVPSGRRINLTGPGADLRLRRMTVGAGDGLTFERRVNRHFEFIVNDPAGEFEFHVGGRLLFRNNQASGLYSGTFDITADYQ